MDQFDLRGLVFWRGLEADASVSDASLPRLSRTVTVISCPQRRPLAHVLANTGGILGRRTEISPIDGIGEWVTIRHRRLQRLRL